MAAEQLTLIGSTLAEVWQNGRTSRKSLVEFNFRDFRIRGR